MVRDAHVGEGEGPPPRLFALSLAALGIVYGDIGTSPLYAVRESFSGHFGVAATTENILGILSLITWSLIVIVSIKYVLLVLRADNDGEGGILALTALILSSSEASVRRRWLLVGIGLFGAALLYGDGILTPAISVLSAVEGVAITMPTVGHFVVPITVGILIGLFVLQHHGTQGVGAVFGPVMVVWFVALALLGVRGIAMEPAILAAIHPVHALIFFESNGRLGLLVLGAVFLVATGAEALYADLGHFGKQPIRLAWFVLVLPALLLNYFGQGALLLSDPGAVASPFYLLAPEPFRVALVLLATMATVIASQAVITGVFSLTQQAVQLGYWPRMEIRHTSAHEYGQIYVPPVNWALMISTVILVLGFQSSSALAGAYGLAIVLTMIVTTVLLFVVAPRRWNWSPWISSLVLTSVLLVELTFLSANLIKIEEGGWIPLLMAAAVFLMMTTWRDGRERLGDRLLEKLVPLRNFFETIQWQSTIRVSGNAVYMTGNPRATPPALIMNFEHQKTIHARVILLTVATDRVPNVKRLNRVQLEALEQGFFRVEAHYGFMQSPDIYDILARLREKGLDLSINETTFFLGRERVVPKKGPWYSRWRVALFSFLSRNSQRATAFFNLPPERVVEVGSQIEV